MRLDDALRAAELDEGRQRNGPPSRVDGRAPQALHDQLEERRFDLVGRRRHDVAAVGDAGAARRRRRDDRVDELWLDRELRVISGQAPVVLGDRPLDGLARAVGIEVLDSHVVREQLRDAALESVELGPRVLADGDEEVHAEVRVVDDPRELAVECPFAALVRVVEK